MQLLLNSCKQAPHLIVVDVVGEIFKEAVKVFLVSLSFFLLDSCFHGVLTQEDLRQLQQQVSI